MTLKQIASLGRKLSVFLALFADCFGRRDARELLRVYVQGQLSDLHRKTAEAMALRLKTPPRTLQRFLESIKWDEEKLRDRCQQIVASDHAHPEAIGCVDESGTTKSGQETVGVGRQYNGNRGKIDNCVVGVHLSYSAPGFQVLLDSAVYLSEEFANDPARRKKHTSQKRSSFAPSRGWPWTRSIVPWAMACGSRHGRSTSCTVVTADSSMA
jgi:SRSO17 transposase